MTTPTGQFACRWPLRELELYIDVYATRATLLDAEDDGWAVVLMPTLHHPTLPQGNSVCFPGQSVSWHGQPDAAQRPMLKIAGVSKILVPADDEAEIVLPGQDETGKPFEYWVTIKPRRGWTLADGNPADKRKVYDRTRFVCDHDVTLG